MKSRECLPSKARSNQAVLTINLDSLITNYRFFRDRAPQQRVGAVLKANAYGLGACPIAETLRDEGCDLFFVATATEGASLRPVLPRSTEILVLNGYHNSDADKYLSHALTPVLNSLNEISDWSEMNRRRQTNRPAAIHIDTGMGRTGLPKSELWAFSQDEALLARMNICMVMTHLACADQPRDPTNREQLRDFLKTCTLLPNAPRSIANSAGILIGEDFLADVVRPGIGLYGGNPLAERELELATVAHLSAPILQIRSIEAGQFVGYSNSFVAARKSRIAVVGVGYADGYPRHLSNRGSGYIAGHRIPVVGRISMDLTCFDITDVTDPQISVGSSIELLGDHIKIDDLAKAAGTLPYEILTRLGDRFERHYIKGRRQDTPNQF